MERLARLAKSAKSSAKFGEEYATIAREKALQSVSDADKKKLKEKWVREDAREAEEEARRKEARALEKAAKKREFDRLQTQSKVVAKLVKDEPLTRGEKRVFEGMESRRAGLSDDEKKAIEEQKRSLEQLLDTYKKDPRPNKEKIQMVEAQIRELTNPTGRGRRTRKHRRHSKRRHTKRRS